jgi:hypothetical protein
MKKQEFINALMPIWIVQIVLDSFQQIFGTAEITGFTYIILALSYVVLPIFVGTRVVRNGGTVKMAIAGALSISLVSIIIVAISFLLKNTDAQAIFGYVLATIMFAILPQILFGCIGYFFGKKLYVNPT